MDGTATVELRLMFGLDFRVVDVVLILQVLQ